MWIQCASSLCLHRIRVSQAHQLSCFCSGPLVVWHLDFEGRGQLSGIQPGIPECMVWRTQGRCHLQMAFSRAVGASPLASCLFHIQSVLHCIVRLACFLACMPSMEEGDPAQSLVHECAIFGWCSITTSCNCKQLQATCCFLEAGFKGPCTMRLCSIFSMRFASALILLPNLTVS